MKLLLKAISLFVLFILTILPCKNVQAQTYYRVKPAIFVAADWKDKITKDNEDQYKAAIVNNLKEVKSFYSQQLNGNSFNIDENVDVVYTDKTAKSVKTDNSMDFYYKANGSALLPEEDGLIRIIWVISELDQLLGKPIGSKRGLAILSYDNLLGLTDNKATSLLIVSHELGHAFGLVLSGYAKGHPCTEISGNECLDSAPKPYPSTIEWSSVMGYGMTTGVFPNLFFNNSLYNPEIWKLYQSPFINPEGKPAPKPKSKATETKPQFTELSPNTIVTGQTFEIRGNGLRSFDRISIYSGNINLSENIYKIVGHTNSAIRVQINEDQQFSPGSESIWKIKLLGKENLDIPVDLTIRGKSSSANVIDVKLNITCGEKDNQQPLLDQEITFWRRKTNIDEQKAIIRNADNPTNFKYTLENDNENSEYRLQVNAISTGNGNIYPEQPSSIPVAQVTNDTIIISTHNVEFTYPKCPSYAYSTNSSGTNLDGSQTSNQSSNQPEKVKISNYSDFRDSNAPGDLGSPTETVDPGSKVTWTLNTLDSSSKKPVFIRVITSDNYRDYNPIQMGDGEVNNDAGVTIQAKMVKKIVEMTITVNRQDTPVDLNNPQDISVKLQGTEGQAQIFRITYMVKYSDGEIAPSAYEIDYRPDNPTPSPTTATVSSCPASVDNCVYNQGSQCYSGYTNDIDSCTWVNGQCLNPTAGCNYSCGPVACPSGGNTNPNPTPTLVPTTTPGATSSCPTTADNCVYSTADGQCYSGHTNNTSTCTWVNGQCLNPTAGCSYPCGPVACPSGSNINPTPPSSDSNYNPPTTGCTGENGRRYNPGDYEKKCTGNCIRNGCYPNNYTGGEQAFRQCGSNEVWSSWQGQCSSDCSQYCSNNPAPDNPAPVNNSCSNPSGALGDWRYQCTSNVCPTDSSQGVGIPYRCEAGQWINKNPYGECTDKCHP